MATATKTRRWVVEIELAGYPGEWDEFCACDQQGKADAIAHELNKGEGFRGDAKFRVREIPRSARKECPECGQAGDGKRCEGCEAYAEHTAV